MNIVWASSEAVPFAKTGGLADVSSSLPSALADAGHTVSVIMPFYPQKMEKLHPEYSDIYENLKVPMGSVEEWAGIRKLNIKKNLTFYFVEFNRFYDRPTLYDWNGTEFADNPQRFIFLSRAVMEIALHLNLKPDIIHANDWHTALCCVYLRSHLYRDVFPHCRSVLTIHNIGYQGNFEKSNMYWTGLGWDYFNYQCLEYYDRINLLKGGIMTADMVSTVSPTYAQEILSPEYGFGLNDALRQASYEGRLRGILNGIDIEVWNAEKDPLLPANFTADDLKGKAVCRKELQKEFHLAQRKNVPLFAVISRLATQKGLDVLADALEQLLPESDIQVAVAASGDPALENRYRSLAERHSDKISVFIGYAAEKTAHLIEAGADFFLMPSRYEPCGLNQMYSMAYGTLPIVRHTGGLVDTVTNYSEKDCSGSTGFVLWDLYPDSLANTIRWAVDVAKKHPEDILKMRKNGMRTDFSWGHTAELYRKMYEDAHK